jgi:hypothetical protein
MNEELPEVGAAGLDQEMDAREVDAGADIVVMPGAPLVHGVEIYHNKPSSMIWATSSSICRLPVGLMNRSSGKAWSRISNTKEKR